MVVPRVRQLVHDLLVTLRGQYRSAEEIEQIARDIVEYGRMIRQEFPEEKAIVNTHEMAYRFREKPRDVARALLVLEPRGQAIRTSLKHYWLLK
jgi:hypothetical protein